MADDIRDREERRLWSRVQRTGDLAACWLWLGTINPQNGYGATHLPRDAQVALGLPRNITASLLACRLAHGPRPAGAYVLHSCDVRLCCNPAHLRWGTPKENVADAMRRGRMPQASRLPLSGPCKRGHEGRWKRDANGKRLCMACGNEASVRSRRRRAEARRMRRAT